MYPFKNNFELVCFLQSCQDDEDPMSPSSKPIVATVPSETQLMRAPDRRCQEYSPYPSSKEGEATSSGNQSGIPSDNSKELNPVYLSK